MKLNKELNEFNRLLADDLKSFFGNDIKVFEDEFETLLFRGPAPSVGDKDNIGSHVVVKLDDEVKEALQTADPEKRAEIMQVLKSNLSNQIRTTYDRNKIGQFVKPFIGNMKIVNG